MTIQMTDDQRDTFEYVNRCILRSQNSFMRPDLSQETDTMKRGNIITLDLRYPETGERFTWKLYRDARPPATWMLEDHTGYLRTLETTYLASLPRVQSTISGYGMELMSDLPGPSEERRATRRHVLNQAIQQIDAVDRPNLGAPVYRDVLSQVKELLRDVLADVI
jgi:hypothetical protein